MTRAKMGSAKARDPSKASDAVSTVQIIFMRPFRALTVPC
jgi:hypothetical protein